MERIELPNGWYLEKYKSKEVGYLFSGFDFWGLSRPTGGFVAESWSEALALDFAAAMNAQAARIERLEKALDMCAFQMNMLPSQEVLMDKLGWSEGACQNFVRAHSKAEKLIDSNKE